MGNSFDKFLPSNRTVDSIKKISFVTIIVIYERFCVCFLQKSLILCDFLLLVCTCAKIFFSLSWLESFFLLLWFGIVKEIIGFCGNGVSLMLKLKLGCGIFDEQPWNFHYLLLRMVPEFLEFKAKRIKFVRKIMKRIFFVSILIIFFLYSYRVLRVIILLSYFFKNKYHREVNISFFASWIIKK